MNKCVCISKHSALHLLQFHRIPLVLYYMQMHICVLGKLIFSYQIIPSSQDLFRRCKDIEIDKWVCVSGVTASMENRMTGDCVIGFVFQFCEKQSALNATLTNGMLIHIFHLHARSSNKAKIFLWHANDGNNRKLFAFLGLSKYNSIQTCIIYIRYINKFEFSFFYWKCSLYFKKVDDYAVKQRVFF